MKKLILLYCSLLAVIFTHAQCPTQTIPSDFIPTSGNILSGVYNVNGDFILNAGDTIIVQSYAVGGCGRLEIYATGDVDIQGVILADGTGFTGGDGGAEGSLPDPILVEGCSNPTDNCTGIFLSGGEGGDDGLISGNGGGLGGIDGVDGTGRKNRCNIIGDNLGRVGGSGGGGGGAGGTYGGIGSAGGNGADGTLAVSSEADNTCFPASQTPIINGSGGLGAGPGFLYGTISGFDIAPGSGGAGGGGGGRGKLAGTAGGNGGNGGGMILIEAQGDMNFSGEIWANGEDGEAGGNGGDGGESTRCCTDICPGVDEYTYTGAGGGGAGAGGGSGGGVFLRTSGVANITGDILAAGGVGGAGGTGGAGNSYSYSAPPIICGGFTATLSDATIPAANAGDAGGNGGGGRVKIFYNACAPGNVITPNVDVNAGGTGAFTGTFYSGTDSSFVEGVISVLNNPQQVCFQGDPDAIFASASIGGYDTITYQWEEQIDCTGPWTPIAGATGLNYDPPAGITDTVCIRLRVVTGTCTEFYDDVVRINVEPVVVASTIPAGTINGCDGDSATLQTLGIPGSSFQWYLNGGPIAGATNNSYVANASGNYVVEVNSPSGACPAFSNPVVVDFAPIPAAFASPVGGNSFCQGDTLTIVGFGTGEYQWLSNNVPIPLATSSTLDVTTPQNYCLIVTDSVSGCADTTCAPTLSFNPNPSATAIAVGPTTICQGSTTQLAASGGVSYQWMIDNNVLSGATLDTLTTGLDGTFNAIVFNNFGCRDTSEDVNVTVEPFPIPEITVANSLVICPSDTSRLVASGGDLYQWMFNGSPIAGATNAVYNATGIGQYSVIATNAGAGCTDTSTTVNVTFHNTPLAQMIALNNPTICDGDSVVLQAAGGVSYQWLLNSGTLANEFDPTYSALATGDYQVVAIDGNGCRDTSVSVNVVVQETPEAEITPIGLGAICENESVPLVAYGGDQYQWLFNGIPIPGANSNVYFASAAGDYSAVVTNSTTSCFAETDEVTVNTLPAPTADLFSPNTADLCLGDDILFQAQGGDTYEWLFNGSAIAGATTDTYVTTLPGNYSVVAINSAGCRDTSAYIDVDVNPLPNAEVLYSGDPEFCQGSSFTLIAAGVGDYQWIFNGIPLPGETNNTLDATSAGDYSVIIVSPDNCIDTTEIPVTLISNPSPFAFISTSGLIEICDGDFVTLTGSGGGTYQWLENNVPIPAQTTDTYFANQEASYSVVVTNPFGCSDTSDVAVIDLQGPPQAEVMIMGPSAICIGDSVMLLGSGGTDYQWLINNAAIPAANNETYTVYDPGQYSVIVGTLCGTDTSVNQSVQVNPDPIAGFTYSPIPAVVGEPIQLIDQSVNAADWTWYLTGGDTSFTQNPIYTYTDSGTFLVTLDILDDLGCDATVTLPIQVIEYGNYYVPNVFTPNNDGFYDFFEIYYADLVDIETTIYDRWGEMVFSTFNPTVFWDGNYGNGEPAPEGVYYYLITGTDRENFPINLKGNVTLLR